MAALIRDWIEQAAARRGADLYLSDARGPAALSYAGLLRHRASTWNDGWTRPGCRPAPGSSSGSASPSSTRPRWWRSSPPGGSPCPLDPAAPDTDVARVLGVARPAAVVYRVDAAPGGDQRDLTGEATGPFESRI